MFNCYYRLFLASLACALLLSEAQAGLLNRLLLMMMRNRRRHYVPFPVSLSPFSNFGTSNLGAGLGSGLGAGLGNGIGTGLYPYSFSSLSNSLNPSAAAAVAAIPYSQYLASLANYAGLTPPIAPLGPWGGINPYYSYLNFPDYPDYRSLYQNYLPLPTYSPPIYSPPTISNFPAYNVSDNKDDKKISTRAAAAAAQAASSGLAYNVQGQDRKELLTKLKYLANHRSSNNYRNPLLYPDTDEIIEALR